MDGASLFTGERLAAVVRVGAQTDTIARCPRSRSSCPLASRIRCASWPRRSGTSSSCRRYLPPCISKVFRSHGRAWSTFCSIRPAYVVNEGEEALPSHGILRRTIFVCTGHRPRASRKRCRPAAQGRRGVRSRPARWWRCIGWASRPGCIRPGYSKALDRFDPTAPRPIDVLFLGAHSLRRTKYLSRAARVLSRHNCVLQVSEDTPNAGDSQLPTGGGPLAAAGPGEGLISLHRDEQS